MLFGWSGLEPPENKRWKCFKWLENRRIFERCLSVVPLPSKKT
jgi:hypothetical protein